MFLVLELSIGGLWVNWEEEGGGVGFIAVAEDWSGAEAAEEGAAGCSY